MDFKITHFLLFVVAAFLLYHLMDGCGCANGVVDGFSVGGQDKRIHITPEKFCLNPRDQAPAVSAAASAYSACLNQLDLSKNQQILSEQLDNLKTEILRIDKDIQENIVTEINTALDNCNICKKK